MKSIGKRTLSRLLGPDFDQEVDEYHEQVRRADTARAQEQLAREEAPWIGATGLSEELERELPRYLRREFGELYGDEGALKASDLEYLGSFPESDSIVHYWRIPDSSGGSYAYVCIDPSGDSLTGCGDKWPPGVERAEPVQPTIRERILAFPVVVIGTLFVALVVVVTYPFAVFRRMVRGRRR